MAKPVHFVLWIGNYLSTQTLTQPNLSASGSRWGCVCLSLLACMWLVGVGILEHWTSEVRPVASTFQLCKVAIKLFPFLLLRWGQVVIYSYTCWSQCFVEAKKAVLCIQGLEGDAQRSCHSKLSIKKHCRSSRSCFKPKLCCMCKPGKLECGAAHYNQRSALLAHLGWRFRFLSFSSFHKSRLYQLCHDASDSSWRCCCDW